MLFVGGERVQTGKGGGNDLKKACRSTSGRKLLEQSHTSTRTAGMREQLTMQNAMHLLPHVTSALAFKRKTIKAIIRPKHALTNRAALSAESVIAPLVQILQRQSQRKAVCLRLQLASGSL